MLQVVAGLTVVFVGYVLYEVYKTVSSETKQGSSTKVPPPPAGTPARPAQAAVDGTTGKSASAEPKKTAAATKKSEPIAAAKAEQPEPAEQQKSLHLKDPATGDTGPAPTNYRFAKKWIKEALVAEGLLDKVYKNADLDESASRKVREALEKFRDIAKYHA